MAKPLILVVDDDESVLGFIQMALEDEGYDVVTAENGAVALRAVQERPPKLILLDLRMPVMTGWEFARAYREMPAGRAPIVVVTAGRDGNPSTEEIDAEAWLSKPFELAQLLAVVARYAA